MSNHNDKHFDKFEQIYIQQRRLDFKCGEIYVTKQGEFQFDCSKCNKKFISLQFFTNHYYNLHSFQSNKIQKLKYLPTNKAVLQNECEKLPNFSAITKLGPLCESAVNLKRRRLNEHSDSPHISKGNPEYNSFSELVENLRNENSDNESHYDLIDDSTKNCYVSSIRKKESRVLVAPNASYDRGQLKLGRWQCDICAHICKKGKERKEHERTHKGVKRLICETCGKGYTKKNRLDDHIRTHTGERPFKCRFCPKTFTSHSSMRSHDRTHIGFKPFKCDFCDKVFKTKSNKQTHEKKHHIDIEKSAIITSITILKPYECNLCGKRFEKDGDLIAHIQRHTNKSKDKPFECSECPSSFVNKTYLNAHERLYHRGEFNYKCDYCDKVFLKLNKKKQHEEMHTRIENEYCCELCDKKYARKEGLAKHRKLHHYTDSPIRCDICSATFTNQSGFREHCIQHNIMEKQFGCQYCEARFDMEIRLERHLKKMHAHPNVREPFQCANKNANSSCI